MGRVCPRKENRFSVRCVSVVGICVSLSELVAVTGLEDPFSECSWGVCVHVKRTDSLYDCECSWDVCPSLDGVL